MAAAILAVALAGALLTVIGTGPFGDSAPVTAQAPVSDGPNVVVIQTDDQRFDTLWAMEKTRRLLGRDGTTFRNHFATHPRCCPSRASYLTGQYTHNHGVRANTAAQGGGYPALDHSETLPVWLERAGYLTGHIGKYMNGYGARKPREIPPGWTEWYASTARRTPNMYGYKLNENGKIVEYGTRAEDYLTDVYADKAVDFIERHAGGARPFFLSVNPLAPHKERKKALVGPKIPRNPRPAPRHFKVFEDEEAPRRPSFDEKDVSDKPRFVRDRPRLSRRDLERITHHYRSTLESLLAVDDLVARIVGTLRSNRELRSTVVIFTSDNGRFAGEHRLPGLKAQLYEEAVRVPLLVRGPGFPAGNVRRQLTANIDLAPTILDLTGAWPGRVMDGISLVPLARTAGAAASRRLLFDTGHSGSVGVRAPRHVYVERETGERELYDLRRDPGELESKHASSGYREVRERLASRLDQLRACAGRSCHPGTRAFARRGRGTRGGGADAAGADRDPRAEPRDRAAPRARASR